ncbi:MAG: M23 family metallopeptidase [Ramlibacter sp.]|nr:M23 family metallopeptidase [Ramlibacter sp.]
MNTQEQDVASQEQQGTLRQAAQEARTWLRAHPGFGAAGVVVSLALGASGAFAVAQPSDDQIVVRQVLEVVQPVTSYEQQAAALRAHDFTLYRSTETRSTDTAAALLKRLAVQDGAAESYVREMDTVRTELLGPQDRLVKAEVYPDHRLKQLTVSWLDAERPGRYRQLVLTRTDKGFVHQVKTGSAEMTVALAQVEVRDSFFRATTQAGIPETVANQMLDIFEPVADVKGDIRKGDSLQVAYERYLLDGQILGAGRVLSASVQVQGKDHQAVWYQPSRKSAKGDYYTPAGEGLTPALLPTPAPGAVITSEFTSYRIHPVFGVARAHTGVDYAAPTGTPVQTIADGVVTFAGWQNGYGNSIEIQHGGKQTTFYAHLSSIGVKVGEKVGKGEQVGKIGSTGWSTGPHLHFETRNNGVAEDPLVVMAEQRSTSIAASERDAFRQVVVQAQRHWEMAEAIQLASAE